LIFLIEGEEETGSHGFRAAVQKHKVNSLRLLVIPFINVAHQAAIGEIDAILVR
jgi:hypothetical protein